MDDETRPSAEEAGDRERLLAYARCLAADIPRGQLGSAVAVELGSAVCEACHLRLLDITGSAQAIFGVLVRHGLLRSLPSQRVMPAALTLLASVSPLVERRSPRCWTIRSGQALEPGSAIGRAIRERVPVQYTPMSDEASPGSRPPSSIRAERDQLRAELGTTRANLERRTTELSAVQDERTALASRVADAEEAAVRMSSALAASRAGEAKLADEFAAGRKETKLLQEALAEAQTQRDKQIKHVQELVAAGQDRERRCRDLEAERTSLKASLASVEGRVEGLRQQAAAARSERDRVEWTVDGVQGQVVQLQRDLAAMQAARDRANEEVAAMRTELEAAQVDAVALQANLEAAMHDLAAERTARGDADTAAAARHSELSNVNARVDQLQAKLVVAEKDLKAVRSERDYAQGFASDYRAQGERTSRSLTAARERIAQLEDEAVTLADKRTAAQQDVGTAKKMITELEARLKEAAAEQNNQANRLTTLTQERDRLRQSLADESKARHAAVEQQKRLTQELAAVRGERDAANEKIEVARERLRRQTAEIAVRQLRAPLSPDIVTREVEVLLGRSGG